MQAALTKPWGKHPTGTIIVTTVTEHAEAPDSVLVNDRRFDALKTGGFLPAGGG